MRCLHKFVSLVAIAAISTVPVFESRLRRLGGGPRDQDRNHHDHHQNSLDRQQAGPGKEGQEKEKAGDYDSQQRLG